MRKFVCFSAFALVVGLGFAAQSEAALYYADTMAGSGLLNGSAPDTVDVPAASWFANDGSVTAVDAFTRGATSTTVGVDGTEGSNTDGTAATLPITLSPNNIYTASVTVNPTGGNGWMYMSFVNAATYGTGLNGGGSTTDQPRAFALVVNNGDFHSYASWQDVAPFNNSGYAGDEGTGAGGTFPRSLGITITVAGDGSATVDYYNGGNLVVRNNPVSLTAAAVSEIQGITIGRLQVSGEFSDFSLDITPVPEPSAFLLLGLGVTIAGGYKLSQWRKRRFAK